MFDLKRFRKEFGLTQNVLQEVLNVSQGFLSKVENGKEAFPSSMYTKLCDRYGENAVKKYVIDDDEVRATIEEAMEFVNEKSKERISDMSYETARFALKFLKYGVKLSNESSGNVIVPREIIEQINDLTQTVHLQQKTIFSQQRMIEKMTIKGAVEDAPGAVGMAVKR